MMTVFTGMNRYKNHKEQHIIPRFYLRGFAPDKKHLCCCSLKTKKSKGVSINNLFSEPDYYANRSTASTTEPALSKEEHKHAKIVQGILKTHTLTINSHEEKIDLSRLILLMVSRTKATRNRLVNRKDILDDSMMMLGITPEEYKGHELDPKLLHLAVMESALKCPDLIADLTPALLINQTSDPFTPLVTSDSPTFFYNLLAKGLTDLNLTDFQNKGLIIFLPLSKKIVLCLFDGVRYKIKNATGCDITSDGNVIISDGEIFDALNRNLVIHADWFVIFSQPEYCKYVLSLQDDRLWGPRYTPVSLKLPFFETYNETTFQGQKLFKLRNEEIRPLLYKVIENAAERAARASHTDNALQ
jgi:hypothetical protein